MKKERDIIFGVNQKTGEPLSIDPHAIALRMRREKLMADPVRWAEYKRRQAERAKAWREKRKQDPMAKDYYKRQCLEYSRKAYERVKQDPEKYAALKAVRKAYSQSDAGKKSVARSIRKMYHNNPQYRIRVAIDKSIWQALKRVNIRKSKACTKYLGCTLEFFVGHITSMFEPGMTWENHGRNEGCWSLDHIKPVAAFDLRDPAQVDACYHYTNLRPMWHKDNQLKSSEFDGKRHSYKTACI